MDLKEYKAELNAIEKEGFIKKEALVKKYLISTTAKILQPGTIAQWSGFPFKVLDVRYNENVPEPYIDYIVDRVSKTDYKRHIEFGTREHNRVELILQYPKGTKGNP